MTFNMTTITSTGAIVLNISSLIGALFTGVICLFILGILFRAMINTHDIVLLLATNSYLALFGLLSVAVIINIDMLRGDFKLFVAEETFNCWFRGYALYALLGVLYNTFGLQAIFRFFRVVYPSYIWLYHPRIYIIIMPFMWIISFLLLLPLHLWHDIQLIPTENACFIPVQSVRGFLWCTVAVYGLPMNIISIVYIQLIRFMRRQSMIASLRAKRDLIVVRRIVLMVSILMMLGIPVIVLELMVPFTDVGKPLFYRISNITMVIVMFVLSLMLVYVTPQIKEILVRMSKRNQVVPLHTREHPVLRITTVKC